MQTIYANFVGHNMMRFCLLHAGVTGIGQDIQLEVMSSHPAQGDVFTVSSSAVLQCYSENLVINYDEILINSLLGSVAISKHTIHSIQRCELLLAQTTEETP